LSTASTSWVAFIDNGIDPFVLKGTIPGVDLLFKATEKVEPARQEQERASNALRELRQEDMPVARQIFRSFGRRLNNDKHREEKQFRNEIRDKFFYMSLMDGGSFGLSTKDESVFGFRFKDQVNEFSKEKLRILGKSIYWKSSTGKIYEFTSDGMVKILEKEPVGWDQPQIAAVQIAIEKEANLQKEIESLTAQYKALQKPAELKDEKDKVISAFKKAKDAGIELEGMESVSSQHLADNVLEPLQKEVSAPLAQTEQKIAGLTTEIDALRASIKEGPQVIPSVVGVASHPAKIPAVTKRPVSSGLRGIGDKLRKATDVFAYGKLADSMLGQLDIVFQKRNYNKKFLNNFLKNLDESRQINFLKIALFVARPASDFAGFYSFIASAIKESRKGIVNFNIFVQKRKQEIEAA